MYYFPNFFKCYWMQLSSTALSSWDLRVRISFWREGFWTGHWCPLWWPAPLWLPWTTWRMWLPPVIPAVSWLAPAAASLPILCRKEKHTLSRKSNKYVPLKVECREKSKILKDVYFWKSLNWSFSVCFYFFNFQVPSVENESIAKVPYGLWEPFLWACCFCKTHWAELNCPMHLGCHGSYSLPHGPSK